MYVSLSADNHIRLVFIDTVFAKWKQVRLLSNYKIQYMLLAQNDFYETVHKTIQCLYIQ